MAAIAKGKTNLSTLARALAEQAELVEDYVTDTRRIGFNVEPNPDDVAAPESERRNRVTLTLDDVDGDFRVNEHAQNQLAQRLAWPKPLWDRLRDNHPDILQDGIGKLLMREPEVRMIRTYGGDNPVARAFLSNRYRRIDNYDYIEHAIAPALMELGAERCIVLAAEVTDLRMYIKVLFPDIQFDDPRPQGGTLHGGAIFGNSEVGAGSFFIDPFMYQSYCLNGLVFGKQTFSDFGLRKMHIGRQIDDTEAARAMFSDDTLRKEDEALFAQAHDVIVGCVNGIRFNAIVEAIQRSAGIKIEGDIPKTVEKLGKATNLREAETSRLMAHLIEGGDLSAYGLVNALTRTAQDADGYDRQVEMERIGGDMLDWSKRAWQELMVAAAVEVA